MTPFAGLSHGSTGRPVFNYTRCRRRRPRGAHKAFSRICPVFSCMVLIWSMCCVATFARGHPVGRVAMFATLSESALSLAAKSGTRQPSSVRRQVRASRRRRLACPKRWARTSGRRFSLASGSLPWARPSAQRAALPAVGTLSACRWRTAADARGAAAARKRTPALW